MREFVGTPRRRSRFTLIEMLVVIAIIAILASMMSPSLMSALDASRRVACQNNLRQQYLGLTAYANDFHDCLPPSPRWVLMFPVMSSNNAAHRGFLYFVNAYLGIATEKIHDEHGRAAKAMHDVLACPGVSQHVPTSQYEAALGMVEYSYYVADWEQARAVRLSRVGGASPYPRMLVCDRLFTACQSGDGLNQMQSRYVIGHRSAGGNVLAGDGSVKWGGLGEAFAREDLNDWGEFPGEKLTLPVLKYLVTNEVGWNPAEFMLYSPDPASAKGWKNEWGATPFPQFY